MISAELRQRLAWGVALMLFATALVWIAARQPHALPGVSGDMVIAGRRGDLVNYPENTLEGVLSAVSQGAPGLEIDVRASAEGTFFLMHDETVDRTTSGSGTISTMSDAAIDLLRTGRDLRVPRLTAVLDRLRAYPGLILLDGKGGAAEHAALAQLVVSRGIAGRVWIGCYSTESVSAVESTDSTLATYGAAGTGADAQLLASPLPEGTQFADVSITAVPESHTGDESAMIREARQAGVDIFITNNLAAAMSTGWIRDADRFTVT